VSTGLDSLSLLCICSTVDVCTFACFHAFVVVTINFFSFFLFVYFWSMDFLGYSILVTFVFF
jgi:hypothetical protein